MFNPPEKIEDEINELKGYIQCAEKIRKEIFSLKQKLEKSRIIEKEINDLKAICSDPDTPEDKRKISFEDLLKLVKTYESPGLIQEKIDLLNEKLKDPCISPDKHARYQSIIHQKEKEKRERENIEIWIIIVYTASCAVVFSAVPLYAFHLSENCFIRQLFYIGAAGGLGGVVYSIQGLIYHYEKDNFSLKFKWWYFFRPITSVILGIMAYLFIAGGLMTFTGMTPDYTLSSCIPSKSVMFFCAMAFLVGISNNAFVKKLKDLAKAFFLNDTDVEKKFKENQPSVPSSTSTEEEEIEFTPGQSEKN